MKRIKMLRLIVPIALLLLVVVVYGQKQGGVKIQWEYKIVAIDEKDSLTEVEKSISGLGAEGWELIEVHTRGLNEGGSFYFKRQK